MKALTLAALFAAITLPLAASAQQAQPYPPQPAQQPYPGQQTTQPYPGQQTQPYPGRQGGNPGKRTSKHWMRLLSGLNLSSDQQQQIQNVLGQFAQAHPAGSARDLQGMQNLRQQIFGILTADQQTQLRTEMQQAQARQQQMRQQMQSQGQPQQGQPPQGQQPPSQQPPQPPAR